jgi:predicted metal-binding membrane protein
MGVMDLRAMTVVSFAMTIERLAPNGRRIAAMVGWVLLGVGLSMGVHAL